MGEVILRDISGNSVGKTFDRRARQLVEKGRAVWTDSDFRSIRLIDSEEEKKMEFEENRQNPGYYVDERKSSAAETAYDETLYKMAKDSVNHRFALIMHMAAYASGCVVLAIFAESLFYGSTLSGFIFLCIGLWSMGMAIHTVYYFARVTPKRIMKEYNKLLKYRR